MTEYEFIGGSIPSSGNIPKLTDWEAYSNHREIITGFIKSSAPPNANSLCILGAGFCRDIELNQLLSEFSSLTLVDLSAKDVVNGVENQCLSDSNAIEIIGDCDLSGVYEDLIAFQQIPNEELLDNIIRNASLFSPKQLGNFDCIVSTCLLSQLICHADKQVGVSHPKFVALIQAIRKRHIEILINSLTSGGTGILVTDFVSTESLPELFRTKDLKATLKNAIQSNNFFHGLNPPLVSNVFNHDDIKPGLQSIRVTDPWRWAMPDRIYACFAVIFKKR